MIKTKKILEAAEEAQLELTKGEIEECFLFLKKIETTIKENSVLVDKKTRKKKPLKKQNSLNWRFDAPYLTISRLKKIQKKFREYKLTSEEIKKNAFLLSDGFFFVKM